MKICWRVTLLTALLSPVLAVAEQEQDSLLSPALQSTAVRSACADLRSLTGYELSIDSAALVPATEDVPEHCRVAGRILPQVQFLLLLPSSWNRRLTRSGNGGWAGRIRPAALARWIRNGDAAVVTDTGHDARLEPGGSFAVDRQKLVDFAYRAVHVTAVTAKQIIATYYQSSLNYSYFFGCSQGGRQSLMSAQRFPGDFDGIVVGAPILDYIGQKLAMAWNARALESGPLNTVHLKVLAERVYEKCDVVDGLEDGVIDDPLRCQFDPEEELPLCSREAGADPCFSVSQLESVKSIYGGPVSHGKTLFPGSPLGLELLIRKQGQQVSIWEHSSTLAERYVEPFFRFAAFEQPDPDYDWRTFSFDADVSRLDWLRPIVDARDPDLRRFRDRGGKILMYHGWTDQSLNAMQSVDYYEEVRGKMGPSTGDFFRLYMVPGMFHCSGGVGVNQFDRSDLLVDWVEKGLPPERIIGSRVVERKLLYTRPLCPYPQVARYSGSGNIDEAANWACVGPPKS